MSYMPLITRIKSLQQIKNKVVIKKQHQVGRTRRTLFL